MRSRYAAYALRLADYIIQTTHPDNPQFTKDHKIWKEQILEFCYVTEFYDLDILEVKEGEVIASVTFHAKLRQRGQEASFSERSHFERVGGNWLYHSGEVSLEK
jgi:SEC-C motif-containing protein